MNLLQQNPRLNPMTKERGTILVISLFMVALIEGIVLLVVLQHRHVVHNMNNFSSMFTAKYLVYGAESKVITQLVKARENQINLYEINIPRTEIDGGTIEGRVMEMQGRYNLNNLIVPKSMESFTKMMDTVFKTNENDFGYEFTNYVKEKVSHVHVNILQNESDEQTEKPKQNLDEDDDEEDDKQKKKDPKPNVKTKVEQPTTVPFISLSELLELPSVTPKIYATLSSQFVVLPEVTPLNVNTATLESFLSLSPKMTKEVAAQIIDNRQRAEGFESVDKFFEQEALAKMEIDESNVTVEPAFYLSSLYIRYNQASFNLYTLFKIEKENEKLTVVGRSINII